MDLSILVREAGSILPANVVNEMLQKAYDYGYKVVALDTELSLDELVQNGLPLPPAKSFFPERNDKMKRPPLKVLTRVTCRVDRLKCVQDFIKARNINMYDIVAVKPLTETLMISLVNWADHYDIISIPTDLLYIGMKRPQFHVICTRGIFLEVPYAPLLKNSASRQNLIASINYNFELYKRKSAFLFSSSATAAYMLRPPRDVVVLAQLLGFKGSVAREAVFSAGRMVVSHARTRKKDALAVCFGVSKRCLKESELWIDDACEVEESVKKKHKNSRSITINETCVKR